mmetsp:Transcript_81872/g.228126  ORF Transcript_81872/g.228126 Transcript_81872/m.228126 type:complete len:222 (+) Transcript_81872:102-767(+)
MAPVLSNTAAALFFVMFFSAGRIGYARMAGKHTMPRPTTEASAHYAERTKSLWTVVHPKQKSTSLAVSPPDDDRTVKESIWDMGKQLCKDKPENPICDKFLRNDAEATVTTAAANPTTTIAPARSTATAAPDRTTQVQSSVGDDMVEGPQKLPSQGFEGPHVRHINGQTATDDWHTEYHTGDAAKAVAAQEAAYYFRSAAASSCRPWAAALTMMACVWAIA